MRLIDADKLCEDLLERWHIADKEKEDLIRVVMADVVTPIVVNQKTIDAVEVVRCKDCKHRFVDGENVRFNCCELNHNKVQSDDWFCADGERRSECD